MVDHNNTLPQIDNLQIETGLKFLQSLFSNDDIILFRPIETWNEGGKKRSQVLSRHDAYPSTDAEALRQELRNQHLVSEAHKANIFFGVCPRFGHNGRYDLAWQIRKINALWTDVDNVTVDVARARVASSGLPEPSIIVNSGNGVHIYWVLEQPYYIDDAGEPPAIQIEWTPLADGRNKWRKYIDEQGERVYLDNHRHRFRLSSRAHHVQDVLEGIAKAIGGDHTTDLARLLRIPGTMNRKDQRNGREPIPTELVACDHTRRHSFARFERFKVVSAESRKSALILSMPMPSKRKPSAAKKDKLAERVVACSVAPLGSRSETDYALCCYAIKNGIDKEHVWGLVENVGKFAENGRRYFDVTWANAELEFRGDMYDKQLANLWGKQSHSAGPDSVTQIPVENGERNPYPGDGMDGSDRHVIEIDSETTPVIETFRKITNCLIDAKNCFLRSGDLVVVNGYEISLINTPCALAGMLNQHAEFLYVRREGRRFQPLSSEYAGPYLKQPMELARLPRIELFSRNPLFTRDWRITPPGFDSGSGIYFAGEAVHSRDNTNHLDMLLQDFCFKSVGDRANYIGVLITVILIPHFIGSKPAVIFNGNQPGLGKSSLAQIIAILRDGRPTETATYTPNDEEFEKRLGAMVRRGASTIIIDNAKGFGRAARIESACLERSITDSVLSFRLLGKSEEIRMENSHIFCITANSPDVSPDLVSRSVVVNLMYEGDPRKRRYRISDPESYAEQYRNEILGELFGMVERWRNLEMPKANVNTRFNKRSWGAIVGGVLEVNGQLGFLENAADAAVQLDSTLFDFCEVVTILANQSENRWTATGLVGICTLNGLLQSELGNGGTRSRVTKMGGLAGRHVGEMFDIGHGRQVVFQCFNDGKNRYYYLGNAQNAMPLPDLYRTSADPCMEIGSEHASSLCAMT